jgi:branched-subunit amino acid aminotransferase/4-amino-4-deoxychorismate lyase
MAAVGDVLINGTRFAPGEARLSVFDVGLQRGYGCFEALRAYQGRIFRLGPHLDRLERSADRLAIALPPRAELERWAADRAAAGGDCVVRMFVTGGLDPLNPGTDNSVIVLAEPLPPPKASLEIAPLPAPWHPGGSVSELTGAKTLSYGPNLAASLAARRTGADDALLIARDGSVLEGPTYSVAWTVGDRLETPGIDLGILESITRCVALEVAPRCGLAVNEGSFPLERMLAADEVVALSTLKEVTPVSRVGNRQFAVGEVAARLAAGFRDVVRQELALE